VNQIVCAIDVGYGHTKYLALHTDSMAQLAPPACFPSFAPRLSPNQSTENYQVRDVAVGDDRYAVGKESALLLPVKFDRPRTANFSQTPEHRALTLGALSYLGQPVIDELVLGLPLNTIGAYKSSLIAEWKGNHSVPCFNGRPGQQTVSVKNVRVIPQPMGAMLRHCATDESLQRGKYLLIDIGFVTMDYMVVEDLRVNTQRAGALEFGFSRYIDEINEYVTHFLRTEYKAIESADIEHRTYEEALRGDRTIRTAWGTIDLVPAMERANQALVQSLRAMQSKIGAMGNIEGVILGGGGATILANVFKDTFPMFSKVVTSPAPQMDIVAGYGSYGLSIAAANHVHA
jgi:plasmid segregation protein ParM